MGRPEDLLSTSQMARFTARGFLEFPAIVPAAICEAYLDEVGRGVVPEVAAGTPLSTAFPKTSSLHDFLAHPKVAGIIQSLVGAAPLVDHHFMHVTYSPGAMAAAGRRRPADSQHWHQDSTIDTRQGFDIQLMWYPHAVTADMGGTRFLPGSHLRIVSEAAIGRYQNIVGQRHVVCPAGTVLVLHHGIWHGAGANRAQANRHMYKVRLNATAPQVRLWNADDLKPAMNRQQPIFYRAKPRANDDLHDILCEDQPWFEADTGRLEMINRVRMWRHLTGDPTFDADYWLSRLETLPGRRDESASKALDA
jgi:hypothetical protein